MASNALRKVREESSRRIASMKRTTATRSREGSVVRHVAAAAAGAGLGMLGKTSAPKDIGGVPIKLGVAVLALAGEIFSKGMTRDICSGVASATLGVYSEAAVRTDSMIAGLEEV